MLFAIPYLSKNQNQEYDIKDLLNQKNFNYLPLKKCVEKECKKASNLLKNMSCIQNCFKSIKKENKKEKSNFQKEMLNLPKDFCLNSKKKSDLTKKQILKEFASGPCNPIILAPGVMSSKLVIQINCKQLKEKEPNTFSQCGWDACEKSKYEFWKEIPKKEYVLWIPSVTGPLSIFSISVNSNLCFANLIKPHFDFSQSAENIIIPRPGVVIKIFGFTEATKNNRDCGGSAIRDLLPLPLQTDTTTAFGNILKGFEHIGYVSGLTMQPIPYNFYYSYRNNEFKKGFYDNLVKLNLHTGKRVTLIGHSMGNINILHNLSLMSLEDKAKLIYNYVSIAPPLLGSPKAVKILLSGNDEFTTLGGYLGFHFSGSVKTCSNQLSIFDLAVKNPFSVYKDQDFLKNYILKRIHYEENDDIPFEESGIPFWPSKDQTCHESSIKDIKTNCNIGFYNFHNETKISFESVSDKYTYDDMQKMFEEYPITKHVPSLFKKLYPSKIPFIKPGVPTFLIFNNSIKTTFKFRFKSNYKQKIASKEYPELSEEIFINGDKTVPTFSSITTPLKWAYDFQTNKSDPENHPVKFVEYCSLLDTHKNVYDFKDESGFHLSKNDYMGLKCKCQGRDLGKYDELCDHGSLVSDFNVVGFLVKVVSAEQSVDSEVFGVIERLEEGELVEVVEGCRHLYDGMFGGVRVEES